MNTRLLSRLRAGIQGDAEERRAKNCLVVPAGRFDELAQHTGCTLLDRRTAIKILNLGPHIVEWGAGGGQVAHRLSILAKQHGKRLHYRGYDVHLKAACKIGNPTLDALQKADRSATLLLCAPPHEDGNLMAKLAVENFNGGQVACIGGTATGGPQLEAALLKRFPRLETACSLPLAYTVFFADGQHIDTLANTFEVWAR